MKIPASKVTLPDTPSKAFSSHSKAVFFMMFAVGLYAIQDVFAKTLPPNISLVEILFFRSVFGLLFIVPMILKERHPHPFRTKYPVQHFLRALATIIATYCFISAFRMMPLAEAYAITFSAPIFMTFFAILFLKEKSTFHRWFSLFLGFTGVLIMFRPGPPEANPGSLIALTGGVFHAVAQLFTRKLSQEDSLSLIIISFTLLTFILTSIAMPFYCQAYSIKIMISFSAIGFLGCAAQYVMSKALQLAPVASIAPFDYAALLWGLLFDALIWHSFPDVFMCSGVTLVIIAGLFLIRSEQKTHK